VKQIEVGLGVHVGTQNDPHSVKMVAILWQFSRRINYLISRIFWSRKLCVRISYFRCWTL